MTVSCESTRTFVYFAGKVIFTVIYQDCCAKMAIVNNMQLKSGILTIKMIQDADIRLQIGPQAIDINGTSSGSKISTVQSQAGEVGWGFVVLH